EYRDPAGSAGNRHHHHLYGHWRVARVSLRADRLFQSGPDAAAGRPADIPGNVLRTICSDDGRDLDYHHPGGCGLYPPAKEHNHGRHGRGSEGVAAMSTEYILGLDGGQSSTICVVGTGDGTLLGSG